MKYLKKSLKTPSVFAIISFLLMSVPVTFGIARNQSKSTYLPIILSPDLYCELEESNNNDLQTTESATGPIASRKDYSGYANNPGLQVNDRDDFFYFNLTQNGQISGVLSNHPGTSAQIVLYLFEPINGVLIEKGEKGHHLNNYTMTYETAEPGLYFVHVSREDSFESDQKYTINVNYPSIYKCPDSTRTPTVTPLPTETYTPVPPTSTPTSTPTIIPTPGLAVTPNLPESSKSERFTENFNQVPPFRQWHAFNNEVINNEVKQKLDGSAVITHSRAVTDVVGLSVDRVQANNLIKFSDRSLLYEAELMVDQLQYGYIYISITKKRKVAGEQDAFELDTLTQCTLGGSVAGLVEPQQPEWACFYKTFDIDQDTNLNTVKIIYDSTRDTKFWSRLPEQHEWVPFKIFIDSQSDYIYFYMADRWIGEVNLGCDASKEEDCETNREDRFFDLSEERFFSADFGFSKTSVGPGNTSIFRGHIRNIKISDVNNEREFK